MNRLRNHELTPKQFRIARRLRRIKQVVIGLAAIVILVCGGMIVTSAIDDYAISRDKGEATAEVVSVQTLRTTVRFRDAEGNFRQPEEGLKYPSGLIEGQNVRVEYQVSDPENVKVQGRGWTLAFLPALSSMTVGLAVCAVLMLLIRRWEKKHKL
ncbi:DUF3592 domain-containing protein [uncultured Corynebacterium sp.]|uniref:DUF3592 domain-containing protein n=1 Tax=uncultured Corynebacterium sp. TaxID=159447 RepID=UPI0025D57059|nr:DUF3592 domain-containing protein [uncultured Corynebacterium sp.]